MGNRDIRNDKVKKPKKDAKSASKSVQVTELPPPVEVIRKKRKEREIDED
jgi:hypothetical protein